MFISEDVKYVGVNDTTIDLFEGQYKVPDGISYNSYVILDEKTAVMDTVDINFSAIWLEKVKTELGDRKPDYLVVQHMEPDHSAVMRYMAVSYEKKLDKGIQVVSEVYVMRFTGMMFIVMSVVLMLIELYSMIHNTARQYARLVIASIAVYTVIKLTRAIINLIKVQKHRSPLLSAIRNISLADAGVSAVTLIRSLTVYAMWLSESDKLIIITCSGVIVYLTTLVLGVAMLLRHTDKNQSADKNAPITADNSGDASKIDTVKEMLTENFVKISDNVVDRYDAISDKANEKNEMLKEHFEERVRHIEEKRKNNDNKY